MRVYLVGEEEIFRGRIDGIEIFLSTLYIEEIEDTWKGCKIWKIPGNTEKG